VQTTPSTISVKGMDRSFKLRSKSRLAKLEARQFFFSHFKWPSSQDQQKTFRRRLITYKVTLTGQSQFFSVFFLLRKVTLPNRINSVK
jgi:hypothetical protein